MQKEAQEKHYQTSTHDDLADVQVLVNVDASRLDLSYQVRAKQPLVVFDALWRLSPEGAQVLDPALAFVSVVPPATLAIRRVIPPLPREKDVERAYLPWAREASVGKPLTGHVSLALPAVEYSPYYPPHARAVYRSEAVQKVELDLAYVRRDLVTLDPVPDKSGVWLCLPGTAPIQHLRVRVDVDPAIPVKRRSDRFEPI